MNLNLQNLPIVAALARRAERAAARIALREAGNLLRAAAPLAIQAADQLQRLSEHPALDAPPPSFDI